MGRLRSDRGAAAVEFAIVLPVLVVILFGVIEYGRIFFIQNTITNAARVGVRVNAVDYGAGMSAAAARTDAQTKAASAAVGVAVSANVTACASGATTTATITYTGNISLTGFLPMPQQLAGRAQMPC